MLLCCRFREAEDNDATRTVLRLCLDSFEGPLLEVTARFKTRVRRETKRVVAAAASAASARPAGAAWWSHVLSRVAR